MAQMDALALEAAEEVFGHGVVIGIALAGHALPDAEAGETLTVSVGGVLDAAVGVEDEAGYGVTDQIAAAQIENRGQVELLSKQAELRHIRDPFLIRLFGMEIPI